MISYYCGCGKSFHGSADTKLPEYWIEMHGEGEISCRPIPQAVHRALVRGLLSQARARKYGPG